MNYFRGLAAIVLFGMRGVGWSQSFNIAKVGEIPIGHQYLEVSGNYLLILGMGGSGQGAYVYDINNPVAPAFKKFFAMEPLIAAHIFGDTLYMRTSSQSSAMVKYDLVSETSSSLPVPGFDFTVNGNILYFVGTANGENGIVSGIDMANNNQRLDSIQVGTPAHFPMGTHFQWANSTLGQLAYYCFAGIIVVDVSKKYDFKTVQYINQSQNGRNFLFLPEGSEFFTVFNSNVGSNIMGRITNDPMFGSYLSESVSFVPKHSINQINKLSPYFIAAATNNGVEVYYRDNFDKLNLVGLYAGITSNFVATYNGNYIYTDDNQGKVVILQYTGLPLPQPEMDAQFVSLTGPQVLAPGQSATLQITMKNTGMADWTQFSYSLALYDDPGGWSDQFYPRAGIGNSPVPPGQNFTFTFNIKAPITGPPYQNVFRFWMVHEFVEFFGRILDVPVAVVQNDEKNAAAKKWFLFN